MNIKNLFFNIFYCNGNQSDAYARYPKRITKKMQHHKLVFIIGGKGKVVIDKKKYDIKRGSLIYYSPDLPGNVEIDTMEPLVFLSVVFDYADIRLNEGKFNVAADTVKSLPLQTVQDLTDFSSVENCFENLVRTWKAKLPGYEFISRTLFQELLISINRNKNNHSSNCAASLKVDKLIQYMREHVDLKVSLDQLAGMVQVSSFHLSKIFKEITGNSVIEYFNKIKMDQAKALLIEGDKKIKEIAHLLGFTDEFYFSRIFKKIEGISPTEYRNNIVHGI